MRFEFKRYITLVVLAIMALIVSVVTLEPRAYAFVLSEEAQWEADIAEAKKRAKDFRRYQNDIKRRVRERESASHEIKRVRAEDEEAREAMRREFVRRRNMQKSDEPEKERLEREWEKEQALLEKKRNEIRYSYVKKRERVEKVLEREAHIDGIEEYDLRWVERVEPAKKP